MAKIAFIGLGTMGLPMASVLRAAGHDIVGLDVNAECRGRFDGAMEPSPTAIEGVEFIITMLPDGSDVEDVHDRLVRPNAAKGTQLIDCSTIDVDTARHLAGQAEAMELTMVDAPVSGGPAGAEAGSLSFMVGGAEAAVAGAWPVLNDMASKIIHFGGPGAGQAAKASHNMICGITAMAVIEGFALADALELDLQKFYQLCAGAAAQSWTLENRCPIPGLVPDAPASNDFAPGFAARLMAKDLRLAQLAAAASGQPTPHGALAAKDFTKFAEEHGDLDFSAFYATLRMSVDQAQG